MRPRGPVGRRASRLEITYGLVPAFVTEMTYSETLSAYSLGESAPTAKSSSSTCHAVTPETPTSPSHPGPKAKQAAEKVEEFLSKN